MGRSVIITIGMVIALAFLVTGVTMIYRPAGFITAGLGIAYLCIVADQTEEGRTDE